MTVALPRAAQWQDVAAPLHTDHYTLIAFSGDRKRELSRIRIDRELFRGLVEAAAGQPFALRPPELIKALERFMAELSTAVQDDGSPVEDVLVESFKTSRSFHFTVSRESRTYSG